MKKVYILCVSCHKHIIEFFINEQEKLCSCGTMVENPYYYER